MNHSFRLVFNRNLERWIVASELAARCRKPAGRSVRVGPRALRLAALALGLLSATGALAACKKPWDLVQESMLLPGIKQMARTPQAGYSINWWGDGKAVERGRDAAPMPNAWLDDYCEAQPPIPTAQYLGVQSRANNGGGGNGGGVVGNGGTGGRGGDGSNIFLGVLNDKGRIALSRDGVAVLKAHSIGGTGGDGGHGGTLSGSGGLGGLGGNGGAIAMLNAGALSTNGKDSPAMFGMSEGGFGGQGGGGSWTPWDSAGHGGAGGNSGAMVTASNLGSISTQGNASDGIHAISVGGNGGAGGVRLSGAGVAIGGNGGGGGLGGNVLLLNEGTITTRGAQSDALSAQSVGGGGGDGGWATAASVGFAFAMGGEAGSGGAGKNIGVHNKGLLSTSGSDAVGMRLQSIGGGGGSGGRSLAVAAGVSLASAVSIGGRGGAGGSGDAIQVLQEGGSIVTGAALAEHFEKLSFLDNDDPLVLALQSSSLSAARSYGILAQSLGGGGGSGGGAVAVAAAGSVGANFASVFTLGGNGGNGGNGGRVQVDSKAFGSKAPSIITYGSASQGIMAQSIGGGGGTGGDTVGVAASVSASKINGNLTLNLGGGGGSGGHGGMVQVLTGGSLSTWGHLSDAVLAQSIGGGGGAGGSVLHVGAGVGSSAYVLGVNLGGTGGSGGRGSDVKVNADINASQSKGTITTRGDFAAGIKAQSVGGGGGNGGAVRSYAVALQAGEGMAGVGSVNLGGRGGSGGLGGKVAVNYGGELTTFGNQSQGVLAQSIGGGGGSGGWVSALSLGLSLNANVAGGKGGVVVGNFSLGGQGGSGNHGDTVNVILGGQAHILSYGTRSNGVVAQSIGGGGGDGAMTQSFTMAGSMFSRQAVKDALSPAYYLRDKFIQQSKTNSKEKGQTSYNFNGNIGGSGGAAGNGGAVMIALSGKLETRDNMSHAVFAQSIGGGGGSGGAALSTGAEGVGAHSLSLSLGGKGGGGGNGGRVALNIGSTVASISTQGDAAFGMLAQSIGGGGGTGGLALASNDDYTGYTAGKAFSFSLGGAGGTGGAGGEVRVYNAASVSTQGTNANGIVAQSVGGGGGVAGSAGTPSATFNVTMGGSGNAGGNSAPVYVGAFKVDTKGNNAIGVLAQSIGGGGGLAGMGALGDSGLKVQVSLGGRGGAGGQSNRVNIGCLAEYSELAGCAGRVRTEGKLAHGIVAQSIGGGGGLVQTAVQGGVNLPAVGQLTLDLSSLPFVPESTTYHGGSDRVMLRDLGHSRIQIETLGDGAVGLLAQSLDGGGGVVSASGFKEPLNLNFSGQSSTGTGRNGGVDIGLNGNITTQGAYAYGIFAQALNGAQTVFTGNRQAEVRGGGVVANGDIDIRLRTPSVISTSGAGAHGIVGWTNVVNGRSTWAQRVLAEGKVQVSGKGAWAVRLQNGLAAQVRPVNEDFMFVDVSGSVTASGQAEGGVAMLNYSGGRNAISVRAGGRVALQRDSTAPSCGVNECLAAQMFSPSVNEVNIYQGGSIIGGTVNLYGPVVTSGSFAGNYVNLDGLLSAAPSRDAAGDARVYDQWGLRLEGINNEVEIAATGELRGGLMVKGQRARLVNRGLIVGNVYGDTLVYTNSGRHVVQVSGKGNSQPAIKTSYMVSSSQATLHVELTELPSPAVGTRPFDLVVTTERLGLGKGITSGAATHLDYSVTDKKVTVNKVEVDYDAWGKNPGLRSAIVIAEAQSNSGEYPNEAQPGTGMPARVTSHLYDYLLDMANETEASTVETSLQNFSLGYADAELSLAAAWYAANHLQSCGDSRLATSSAIEQGSCSWAKVSYDDMQLGGGAQQGYAWGFNGGWQRELGGGFYAGASAGYGRTNFANRGISGAEGHRVSLGGILKYVNGNIFGAASLIGGYAWGDGARSVRVSGATNRAESEHETWLLSARLRGGYNFDFGRGFSVTPSLDMNLPVIHDRGYREQGAGEFNMEVLSSTNLVPDLYPALQFGKQFQLGKASARSWVEVGSRIRLDDLNSEVRLPDGFTPNTITRIGYRPDRSSTLWSTGLLLEWSERMEARVIYEEENGSSIRSRGGSLKLAWKF